MSLAAGACLLLAVVRCAAPAEPPDAQSALPWDIQFPGPDAPAADVAPDANPATDAAPDTAPDADATQDAGAPDAPPRSDTPGRSTPDTPSTECSPGARRCAGVKARERCDVTGHWRESGACALATACHPPTGACAPIVCEPQSSACASSFAKRRCLPTGTGWEAAEACPDGHGCRDGTCIDPSCLSQALILVDASSSMGVHWDAVQASIAAVAAANPKVTFGLVPFPAAGACGVTSTPAVPLGSKDASALGTWFQSHPPYGQTPLVDALAAVEQAAPALFPGGGSLLLLSDGADTCAWPLEPDPAVREAQVVEALAASTAALRDTHDVDTWVIGYAYQGSTAQLDAIAQSGGTPTGAWIPAGSEQELLVALETIVADLKGCLK